MQGCITQSTQNIKNNFVKDYYYINRKLVFKNSSNYSSPIIPSTTNAIGEKKKNSKVPSLLANESRGMASRSGGSGKGIYSLRRVSIFQSFLFAPRE